MTKREERLHIVLEAFKALMPNMAGHPLHVIVGASVSVADVIQCDLDKREEVQ